jgi:anaerobic selenocysteine-containing dehydrogenase
MDLHALCPAQSANHIMKKTLQIQSLCRRKVVTNAARLAASFSGRSGRWVWVANERGSKESRWRTEGLRALVFAISEGSTVAAVSARRTLSEAA